MVNTKPKNSRSGPGRGRRRIALALSWAVVASGLAAFGARTLAVADDAPAYTNTTLPFSVRAADLVSRMTLEEKFNQLSAIPASQSATATWGTHQKPITRLGVKKYGYWGEATHGIQSPTLTSTTGLPAGQNYTMWPQSMAMSSTWNPDAVKAMSDGISDEARVSYNTSCPPGTTALTYDVGIQKYACYGLTYWSPNHNIIRDPRWGRADESYSEDPFMTGEIASAFVDGLQGDTASRVDTVPTGPNDYVKAVATPKHYFANSSEANRNTGTSNFSERMMYEYFLPPFARSAGNGSARSAMTAYNGLQFVEDYTTDYPSVAEFPTQWSPNDNANGGTPGTPAAGSRYAVETLLRRTFGFDGVVVSDCDAISRIHETTSGHAWKPVQLGGATAVGKARGAAWGLKAGTDLDCSGRDYTYDGPTVGAQLGALGLLAATNEGYATEADIDVALVRAFTARFQMGEFDPVASVPWNNESWSTDLVAGDPKPKLGSDAHQATSHEAALEAPVLLKNDGTLPFSGPTTSNTVAMGFPGAITSFQSGGYSGPTGVQISFAQGLAKITGNPIADVPGTTSTATTAPKYISPSGNYAMFPDVINSGGTAVTISKCANTPCDPGTADVDTAEYRISVASNIVVFAGHRTNDGGEGSDRADVSLPRQQAQMAAEVAQLAKQYGKKIVVWLQGKSIFDISSFKDHPGVGAIVWSSFNGSYQGDAAAELLFFDPAVTLEDGRTAVANFSGKLPLTWYADPIGVLGVSASPTLGIQNYKMTKAEGTKCGRTYLYYQVDSDAGCDAPHYVFGHGLSYASLEYDAPTLSATTITPNDPVRVSVDVSNQVPNYSGKAVVEVYAKAPSGADGDVRPLKQLKGFGKTSVLSGNRETVSVTIDPGDLWFWDEVHHKKVFPTGNWTILAGPSSADADLKSVTLTVTGQRTAGVEVVAALPDGHELSLDTPDNQINAMASVTKHDQTFWDLSDPALQVTYTSNDPAIATADASGTVSGVAKGATLIRVTATANGESKSTSFPVAVTSGPRDATDSAYPNTHTALVDFADRTVPVASAAIGVQLSAKLVPGAMGASYSYRIAPMDTNTAGASVSAAGVLTAKRAGFVRVTVTATDAASVKTSESALIRVSAVLTKEDLQKALDAVRALDPASFTTSSWTAADLAGVAAAADAVLANPAASPAEIAAAADALIDGMAKLVYRGDPAVLAALIATATGLNGKLGSFTSASAGALSSALTDAQTVYAARADKTQAELDAAASALQTALAGLVVSAPVVEKAVLQSAYDAVLAMSNATGGYTSSSWGALQAKLTAAKTVLDNASATQAAVDTATKELTAALAGLVIADPAVDKSVLQSAYDAALAMSNSGGKYTSSSWGALQAKVTAAKTVLDNGTASQVAVNTAVKELTAALAGLVVADPVVSKAVLQSAYDAGKALSNSGGKYTSASWSKLQSELTDAKAVLDNGSATQAAVDAAAQKVTEALAGLVVADPAVSKTVLQKAYDSGKALSNSNSTYTSASWSKLQGELTAAKAVLDNASATQAAVDAATQSLTDALAGLVVADPVVDKAVLQHTYDAGKALAADKYTSATWGALQSELTAAKAVLDNGSATQAQVDGALKRLTSALAGLTGVVNDSRIAIDDPAVKLTVDDKVYAGSQVKSGFSVTMGDRRLYEGVDFATSIAGENITVGKGSITIIGKGDYSGSRLLEFRILPSRTSISKAKAGKKSVKVSYKKVSSGQKVSSYQVQYQIKGTSSWKTVTVSASKSSVKLTKLKKGKVYQVRVRSLKAVSGVNYCSAWSASKNSSKVK